MKTMLTPLDGRYYDKIEPLVAFLSETALIKHRLYVEIEWLKVLRAELEIPIDNAVIQELDNLVATFDESVADEIKTIEKTINHDVKAVEVWLCSKLDTLGQSELVPFVHFGRTSEDINNVAYALMLKGARENVLLPAMADVREKLTEMATKYASLPMLARTHGQSATPTTLGKEMAVFAHRLTLQVENIENVEIMAKFNGATGTFSADMIAYPDIDWPTVMHKFINNLGLSYNPLTTQIEPHDWIARLNNEFALSGSICMDLCRDFWQYISAGYLTQTVAEGEVGSSTMPHKVNPIDFENAEANFGVANALLRHLSEKLPISRLQRDLSDSSALRSLSEAYGHFLVALVSLNKGLSKVTANPARMLEDLAQEWSLLTEAVQTIMRKNGIADAYDQLKYLARAKLFTGDDLHAFISKLEINDSDKKLLLDLTPQSYTGLAEKLAKSF